MNLSLQRISKFLTSRHVYTIVVCSYKFFSGSFSHSCVQQINIFLFLKDYILFINVLLRILL